MLLGWFLSDYLVISKKNIIASQGVHLGHLKVSFHALASQKYDVWLNRPKLLRREVTLVVLQTQFFCRSIACILLPTENARHVHRFDNERYATLAHLQSTHRLLANTRVLMSGARIFLIANFSSSVEQRNVFLSLTPVFISSISSCHLRYKCPQADCPTLLFGALLPD